MTLAEKAQKQVAELDAYILRLEEQIRAGEQQLATIDAERSRAAADRAEWQAALDAPISASAEVTPGVANGSDA